MRDLIERLEKATGPNRQLDRMIEETLPGVRQHDDKRMVADGYVLEANGIQAYLPAHYTASIDAALTLVPEGWGWGVGALKGTPDRLCNAEVGKYSLRAATPAIALCIAALRAREADHACGYVRDLV